MTITTRFIATACAGLLLATPAVAADHQVQMLNKDAQGRGMQFEPAFLRIEPGDTVTFIPTDKSHNSESIPALMPGGEEPWKGKINQEVTVTFEAEGFYAYKCLPHLGMGMIGLIQVGNGTAALDQAEVEKLPKRAEDRLLELLAQAADGVSKTTPAQ